VQKFAEKLLFYFTRKLTTSKTELKKFKTLQSVTTLATLLDF